MTRGPIFIALLAALVVAASVTACAPTKGELSSPTKDQAKSTATKWITRAKAAIADIPSTNSTQTANAKQVCTSAGYSLQVSYTWDITYSAVLSAADADPALTAVVTKFTSSGWHRNVDYDSAADGTSVTLTQYASDGDDDHVLVTLPPKGDLQIFRIESVSRCYVD